MSGQKRKRVIQIGSLSFAQRLLAVAVVDTAEAPIVIIAIAVPERRHRSRPALRESFLLLGDANCTEDIVAVALLAVGQRADNVALRCRGTGTIGFNEGAVLGIEQPIYGAAQADVHGQDILVVGTLGQRDQLLAILPVAVGIFQRSELICEALQLVAELMNGRIDQHVAAFLLGGVIHEVFGVPIQPDVALRLTTMRTRHAGVDRHEENLFAAEILGRNVADVLLHVIQLDDPGGFTGDQAQDVEDRWGLRQKLELSLHTFVYGLGVVIHVSHTLSCKS